MIYVRGFSRGGFASGRWFFGGWKKEKKQGIFLGDFLWDFFEDFRGKVCEYILLILYSKLFFYYR
jgi:hypothetical protein